MQTDSLKKNNAIFGSILLVVSLICGLLLSEMLYRVWLSSEFSDQFISSGSGEQHPPVWFFEQSRWRFNEEFGYEYGPETVYGGSAMDGTVRSCWSWPSNSRGNMGEIKGSYDDSDIKILVFGDSWTAQQHENQTWPNFLQKKLSDRTGKSVHVVNFGRDGTGILHMFDLAAAKVPEWKPDLAIFAFITDDLTRARFWRTAVTVDGVERVLTTTEAKAFPDIDTAADTAVVNSRATREWCREAVASGRKNDPILTEMETVVRNARARNGTHSDLYGTGHSFLFDRLVYGNPFHTALNRARPSQNPRHDLTDFGLDKRFMKNLERIRASGVPVVLVHFSIYDELLKGKEYIAGEQQMKLVDSLSDRLGVPVYSTIPNAALPMDDLAAIKSSPNDAHPSLRGMSFYADVVSKILLEKTALFK